MVGKQIIYNFLRIVLFRQLKHYSSNKLILRK